MPKLTGNADGTDTYSIGGTGFTFSAVRIDGLGATEYCLVDIEVDVTGSTAGFASDLRATVMTAIEACKRSPRSNNLLVRVSMFSTRFPGGYRELHGYMPLEQIDPNRYPDFNPSGYTPLFDATFGAIGSMVEYGSNLMANDFLANGIVFVITDGWDNRSTATPAMVGQAIQAARRAENLESIVTILIGVNATDARQALEQFQHEAGIDNYIDLGAVTKSKLAKLAAFVSQSVSSQSQAIGTGGRSQAIAATI